MTNKKKINGQSIARLVLALALVTGFFQSCEKDDNSKSPLDKLRESEKLIIPGPVDLPVNPSGNSRVATYYAEGVQQYKSQLKAGSTTEYEWVFVAPVAKLFSADNKEVGTHGAGPFWEIRKSDSIFAQHFTPARTAPSPAAGNIDWLLLQPKAGKPQTGIFAEVDYIQRIDTQGGKAPAAAPQSANETSSVPYTAIYRFSKINP